MPPDVAPTPDAQPSSRLCVKNIPKYVDEARLKEFFSKKGEVTDVKVLRTKDGRSRQLGFIGFKTVDEAAAALRYYDRSYMDTAKLTVEFARKVGDDQLPRAWSKHTAGTSANKKQTAGAAPTDTDNDAAADQKAPQGKGKKDKKKVPGELLPEEEDPKLREFLALMQPRAKAKIWANDEMQDAPAGAAAGAATAAGAAGKAAASRQQQQEAAKAAAGAAGGRGGKGSGGEGVVFDDDDDEVGDDQYQDWTARTRQPGSGGGSDDEDEEMEEAGGSQDSDSDGGGGGGGLGRRGGGRDEVVVNAAVSDLDYLRSRMRRWDEEDEEEEEVDLLGRAMVRGDQSGVGVSPRCAPEGQGEGEAGKGAKGSKKAKAAATAAAGKQGRPAAGRAPAVDDGDGGAGGSGSGGEDGSGDADLDADMEDADGRQQGQDKPPPQQQQRPRRGSSPGDAAEEGIMDTGRLFVRNLAYTATETDLSDLFGTFGDLQEVHLVADRETKRSKGLAYVQYQIPEDAVRAAQQLDGTIYQGRLLHILAAKRQRGAGADPAAAAPAGAEAAAAAAGGEEGGDAAKGGGRAPGLSSFKAAREAQRKADAGNRAAWNTLFMRPDTVAEAVAAHYGLSKAALLDPSAGGQGGDSVAVRMALGEAQVIAATKHALAEAGVSVEALERAAAASGKASATRTVSRSGTTLLVKNLPYSADEDELSELFGRFGPVSRLVLPPARALALVEFTEPQDARSAFKSLAYKKYQHVPLYLEWAPADTFTAPAPPQQQQQQQAGARQAPAGKAAKPGGKGAKAAPPDMASALAPAADAEAHGDGAAADANPAVMGTIYVKNLAFATTDAALRRHFDGAVSAVGGSLHSAVVARKKGGKDGETVQSLGYGFVEVDSEAVAAAVIKKLQGSMLDGHKLALQLSRGRKTSAAAAAGGVTRSSGASGPGADQDGSTKLVVRNLAFEATKKDIQGLFNPFGHLKSCRLPKKFDGSHRGFAFVEFVTRQEARNALEGVGGTHLYGRRLVVEYAREDDSLDDIRNKTAAKFKRDGEAEAGGAPEKRLKV